MLQSDVESKLWSMCQTCWYEDPIQRPSVERLKQAISTFLGLLEDVPRNRFEFAKGKSVSTGQSALNNTLAGDAHNTNPAGASEQDTMQTTVSARKTWKTVKSKPEPIWPTKVEKASLKGAPHKLHTRSLTFF